MLKVDKKNIVHLTDKNKYLKLIKITFNSQKRRNFIFFFVHNIKSINVYTIRIHTSTRTKHKIIIFYVVFDRCAYCTHVMLNIHKIKNIVCIVDRCIASVSTNKLFLSMKILPTDSYIDFIRNINCRNYLSISKLVSSSSSFSPNRCPLCAVFLN